ncbi:DUF302 domain-containing protein [Kitasatospora sp. NPDC094015]|uniref:DUF302 domain-containing protein n=1 Tax=Kitasatospora sp. NPDC094015 TaxID=3155205 RepID=UPI00331F59F8
MTRDSTFTDLPARRLVVTLPKLYDETVEEYETLVPEVDLHRFYQMASWPAAQELAEINAPQGFMRYHRSDLTALMAGSTSLWKATQYFMGNHVVAERVFHHDPSAMLHAPLPAVLYADPDGDTKFAVDQPSLLLAGHDNPEIAEVGREFDALLARLIVLLGGEAPPQLGEAAAER